jgi:hypothetical protein
MKSASRWFHCTGIPLAIHKHIYYLCQGICLAWVQFLYSNAIELRHLCTQPPSDFVYQLLVVVKLLAIHVSLNANVGRILDMTVLPPSQW